MNTSARKLKRRLQDEGTTFRALLGDERPTLTEVAERLGFSDLSSFSQAFKRWYGVAPGGVSQVARCAIAAASEVALDNGRAGSAQRGRRGYGLDVTIDSLLLTGMPRIHRRRDACEAIRCIERTPRRDSQDRRSQSRVECARIRVCPARRRHG
ncbi:helix-turn-helix domain-containing protein [Burkholderia ubonensis]|uniref:helix-turn-helix domain-containing protein n=1 Tax=Burkholderia ubonensis TaxID=101571 RepID=UPI0039F5C07E